MIAKVGAGEISHTVRGTYGRLEICVKFLLPYFAIIHRTFSTGIYNSLNLIEKGSDYKELKKGYIIFICMQNPFKKRELHLYSFGKDGLSYYFLQSKLTDNDIVILFNYREIREILS